MTIRSLIFMFRHKRACKRLQREVEKRRNSFKCQDYRRRREAALKGMSLRQLSQGG